MGRIQKIELITLGASQGGLDALTEIFKGLSEDFFIPIIAVYHRSRSSDWQFLKEHFAKQTSITIKEIFDSEIIRPGHIYFAPPDYHVLLEDRETLLLTLDERINFSRPSIDVLFKSASQIYKRSLMGILLTGANTDGAEGLCQIARAGGYTLVQTPTEAASPTMPKGALDICGNEVDAVENLINISKIMNSANAYYGI